MTEIAPKTNKEDLFNIYLGQLVIPIKNISKYVLPPTPNQFQGD